MQNILVALILSTTLLAPAKKQQIDRKAVVSRHNVTITEVDTLTSLSLGNGRFAMTMDVTGLQTFPEHYKNGVPLGTMSEWGWHSFPTAENYSIEETLDSLKSHGRKVPYAIQANEGTRAGRAANYLRENPHRIHLATISWHIEKADGRTINISDVKKISQQLDLWKGELISYFEIEGTPVKVTTLMSQRDDKLGVRVQSELIKQGRLGLTISYPYPTGEWLDEAVNYAPDEMRRLEIEAKNQREHSIRRTLDSSMYFTGLHSSENIKSVEPTGKGFRFQPTPDRDTWSFFVTFSDEEKELKREEFRGFQATVHEDYSHFWQSGGMIDFGEVKDPRAAELERRMILSLYLTQVNTSGKFPPQETGLTYNSWYGKPHMEMIWWHGVHYALWGRPEILQRQMEWYLKNRSTARAIAKRQGFDGVRWQKMTDNDGGETVSSIGSYLIWQQPHIIYFSALLYQLMKDDDILQKYAVVVEETAAFMADFAWYDSLKGRSILGPGVIPAQERFDPAETFNPTYELAYWRWGLEAAQNWRERLGKKRNPKWDEVLEQLSPLPVKDSLYLATENADDSYSTARYMTDHPSVLGTYGMLPATQGFNEEIMRKTFLKIWDEWQWEDTWGWDFPMAAMTATRLGLPEKAVDALLMPIRTNTYLNNGHNFQDDRLRLYLPGNGGLLTALAMMAAGTRETTEPTPGFPKEWAVKHEGLNKIP